MNSLIPQHLSVRMTLSPPSVRVTHVTTFMSLHSCHSIMCLSAHVTLSEVHILHVTLIMSHSFPASLSPCRGTEGQLAGGAASSSSTHWHQGTHNTPAGPLPPFPFPLPPEYDAALSTKYATVMDMRARIKAGGMEESRRQQLQAVVQAYFRDWLQSSSLIRQVGGVEQCLDSGGFAVSSLETHPYSDRQP